MRKTPPYRYSILLLLLLGLLLCPACSPRQIQQDPGIIDQQVYQPETVYIGAILPLSGEDKALAEDWQAAMEVAVEIINESHDIDWDLAKSQGIPLYGNAQVELVYGDCESNEMRTSAVADQILEMGVVSMVGAGRSEYTAVVGKRCRVADIPLLAGSSNSSALTDGVTYTFGQWFNRIAPDPTMESSLFFSYIKHLNQTQNANIKTIAVVYQNTVHSLRTLDIFYEQAEEAGLEVLASVSYDPKPESVTLETSKVVTAAPDAVAHIGGDQELALFLQGYVAAQYVPKVMLCYFGSYENQALAEAVAELGVNYVAGLSITPEREPADGGAEEDSNSIQVTLPTTIGNNSNSSGSLNGGGNLSSGNNPSNEVTHQELEKTEYNQIFAYIDRLYQAKTGKPMSDEALLEFASVIVTAQAIGKCGTTDPAVLQTTLKENVFEAPYLQGGSIDFDELGQNTVMNGYLTTITQDGRYVQIFKQ